MLVKIATVPITGTPSEIAETLRERATLMGPVTKGCIHVGVQVSGVPGVRDGHKDMNSHELQELADKIDGRAAVEAS